MLGQAEVTRSAVGLAQERAVLAAYNVVHAVATGADSDPRLRERACRVVTLVDAAAGLEREQAAILGEATQEDECRATSGVASTSSVWAATSEGPPDPVARELRQRLSGIAERAIDVASAANEVIGEWPRALSDIDGAPSKGRRRGRPRVRRLQTASRRGA